MAAASDTVYIIFSRLHLLTVVIDWVVGLLDGSRENTERVTQKAAHLKVSGGELGSSGILDRSKKCH